MSELRLSEVHDEDVLTPKRAAQDRCKNCEYFESWHGWPRGDCDHPTLEVSVEVNAFGTCDKFEKEWTF